MSAQGLQDNSAVLPRPNDVVRDQLERLSTCIGPSDAPNSVDAMIRDISSTVERITVEHAGMAEELLSVYEQLGAVFEVTRRLPTVSGEREVFDLFVETLRGSFHGRDVFLITDTSSDTDQPHVESPSVRGERGEREQPDTGTASMGGSGTAASLVGGSGQEGGERRGYGPSDILDGWFRRLIERARNDRSVVVESAEGNGNVRHSESEASSTGRAAMDGGVRASTPPWRDRQDTDDEGVHVAEAMVGPVFAGEQFVGALVLTHGPEKPAFRASDMMLLEALSAFCGDVIRTHRLVHELRTMSIAMVRALVNAVDQKDPYTSGHSLRVGYYATLLGKAGGLRGVDLQMLQWSALLHDVGKIGIRDDVLKKEGKLTDEEFCHIKEHPVRSYQVVQEVPQLAPALDGVRFHHERYDGTGYPDGLAGEEIPLQARILQIADIFDALTSHRSYRSAFDWRKALDILREEAGRTVHPELQLLFDGLIRSRVDGVPNGWERMVRSANQFAPTAVGWSQRMEDKAPSSARGNGNAAKSSAFQRGDAP